MPRLKMHGPQFSRKAINDFLTANFPAILADLRIEWKLTLLQLPEPVRYVAREPDNLDVWPTIAVTTGVESTTRRIEHGDLGGEFVTTYPIEVYSWINAENKGPCEDMRDYMATAVKVALLLNPTLKRTAQDMLLNESTFEQRYSDLQKVKGERYVAGSMSAFDLTVVEHLGPFGTQSSDTVGSVAVRGDSEGAPFGVHTEFTVHPAFE